MNEARVKQVAAVLGLKAQQELKSPTEAVTALMIATAALVTFTAKSEEGRDQLIEHLSLLLEEFIKQQWNDPVAQASRAMFRAMEGRNDS